MNIRAHAFQAYYWAVSILFALVGAVSLIVPGRAAVSAVIKTYARAMVAGLWLVGAFVSA